MELSHRVQYAHVVGGGVVVRVEHDADIGRDGSAQINTSVVERELIEIASASGFDVLVAGLYSDPDGERRV